MDEIDRQIIHLLHDNGRMSQEQIAREVNLSRPAVHERVRRLEDSGVIRGYRAVIDWSALGQPITAFTWVRTSNVKVPDVYHDLMQQSDENGVIEECHRVTGDWCFLLKLRVASPAALEALIDRIRDVRGVTATTTHLALSSVSERAPTKETPSWYTIQF